MSGCTISQETVKDAIRFHGHWCPGLAIGIRASELALKELGKDGDEDIVVVSENDTCAVDGIQFLTGCTMGKGNLLFKDLGKMAFSFYRRSDGKALRLFFTPPAEGSYEEEFYALQKKSATKGLTQEEKQKMQTIKERRSDKIMEADLEEIFSVTEPAFPEPRRARILQSVCCEECGETMMETRSRRLGGKVLCIPCFEAMDSWQ
jgi:formylmethanofuran dehydrogenase subunit E